MPQKSWTFSCSAAARTNSPGHGGQPTATTTRSACFAPPNTSTTGKPCGALSAWSSRRRGSQHPAAPRSQQETELGAARAASQAAYRRCAIGSRIWAPGMRGTIENLSQSGVLFQGPQNLPQNTLVEMVFEMPEEISGQKTAPCCARDGSFAKRRRQRTRKAQSGSLHPRLQVSALESGLWKSAQPAGTTNWFAPRSRLKGSPEEFVI